MKPGAHGRAPPAIETWMFLCRADALFFCNFSFGRAKEKFFKYKIGTRDWGLGTSWFCESTLWQRGDKKDSREFLPDCPKIYSALINFLLITSYLCRRKRLHFAWQEQALPSPQSQRVRNCCLQNCRRVHRQNLLLQRPTNKPFLSCSCR